MWLSWLRICLQCRRTGFDPWVEKIPWGRERQPTPAFQPGESHGLYSPWGCKESDMTERLSLHFGKYNKIKRSRTTQDNPPAAEVSLPAPLEVTASGSQGLCPLGPGHHDALTLGRAMPLCRGCRSHVSRTLHAQSRWPELQVRRHEFLVGTTLTLPWDRVRSHIHISLPCLLKPLQAETASIAQSLGMWPCEGPGLVSWGRPLWGRPALCPYPSRREGKRVTCLITGDCPDHRVGCCLAGSLHSKVTAFPFSINK